MTKTQQTLFEKFLAKATLEDLHILGHGTIKATGQEFYAVSSSTGEGCYPVIICGNVLMCYCPAGRAGRYCKHRALVRNEMMQRAATIDAAYMQQGVALMAAAIDAAEAERAAALPVRRDGGPRFYRDDAPCTALEERVRE